MKRKGSIVSLGDTPAAWLWRELQGMAGKTCRRKNAGAGKLQ